MSAALADWMTAETFLPRLTISSGATDAVARRCDGRSTRSTTRSGRRHLHVPVFPPPRPAGHRARTWARTEEREPYAERLATALGLPRTFG